MSEPKLEARLGAQLGAKSRWKIQIEQSLAKGNFAEAMTLVHKAFAEFADDPVFLALEEQVTHGRERSVTVFQMMEEGRQLCGEQNYEEGLQVLRDAYGFDERNSLARSTLVDNLLCHALAVLESDLPLAQKLAKEANALDPGNPVNKSVAESIREYQQAVLAEPHRPPAAGKTADSSPPITAKPTAAAPLNMIPSGPIVPVRIQEIKMSGGIPPTTIPGARTGGPIPSGQIPSGIPNIISSVKPSAITDAIPSNSLSSGPFVMQANASASLESARPAQSNMESKPQSFAVPDTTKITARPDTTSRARRGAMPLWMWAASGIAALVLGAVLLRPFILGMGATAAPISVAIRSNPPGAAVRINGQDYDIAQEVSLPPGSYRIEAALDGYQPVVLDVNVSKESREPIELNLLPSSPMLRISTDLASGAVSLDGQSVGNLQNGQFAIDSIAPGEHLLRISSGSAADAVIPLTVAAGEVPALASAISAKNLRVFVLASSDGQGHVYSSFGPATLKLDGHLVGPISLAKPLELASLTAASHEFLLVEGNSQRKISLDAGTARSLFISVISDRDVGTLEIVSNAAGFQLQINGKPAKFNTQRGRYFVYNVDAKPATIQISKAGFDITPAAQDVVIKKGTTARAAFKLEPTPTTATLRVIGVLPGTRVSVDGTPQTLQPDGNFTATVAPGDHGIEFARQGFKPKLLRFSAKAGQTIALGGSEVLVNDATTGKITIATRNPSNAAVILRRGGTEIPIPDREAELPEGDYALIATATGYREESRSVRIVEGTPAVIDVKLVGIPQIVRMEGWEDAKGWKMDDGWYKRKGGMFVLFKGSSNSGTIQFTAKHKGRQLPIFRGGKIRWVVNYLDTRNYDLYEMDGQKLSWKRFVDGKPGPEKQAPHGVKIQDDTYRLTVEVGGGQLAGKIFDGKIWKPLPSLAASNPNPREGKFGFLMPNNEEMWLSDFVFKPNE